MPTGLFERLPKSWTPEQRFWAKVDRTGGDSACWIWHGGINDKGYGRWQVSQHEPRMPAHRYSFELVNGAIPAGLVLDHLCRNPPCVNPAHLESVTCKENLRRGRHHRREQTHCIHGHELSGSNIYIRANGGRMCLSCGRERKRRYKAERR